MARPAAARPRLVAGLRLLERVGEGAEGEVWDARDPAGRRRALKLIRPDALVPPAEVERRGRWLLAIDHPALVAVHRCGVLAGAGLDGWGFVEMSFVEGPSLDDAPADPDALLHLAPLAEGLDLLHAGWWSDGVPLIHRDVKPANLIEAPGGALVLVDASTLREVDDGTRTRIGTPVFAAPEVVTGRAGPLADVYAFAATAIALRSGARRRALADLLAAPEDLDVPAGLRAALDPDPARRPVSCRAALDPALPLVVGAEVGWQPVEAGRLHPDGGAGPVPPAPEDGWPSVPPAPPETTGWGPVEGGHLAAAADVLLDPWTDPYAAPAPPAPWGLVVLLAVLAAVPLAAAVAPVQEDLRRAALLGAGGAAAVTALGLGRPLLQAVLLPPLAWATALGDRIARRQPGRAWARVTCLAGTVGLWALTAGALLAPDRVDPVVAAGLAPVAWGVVALAVPASRSRLLRLALAPAWAAGAALVVGGGLLLLAPALLVGRLRAVLGAVTGAVRSAAAFVRRG